MAPKRVTKVNNLDYKKLTVNDVLCPLCRGILIRPITLPCSHGFCETCFQEQAENANCPMCNVRVGSWLRSAKKSNRLVNEALWSAIQVRFPSETNHKLSGKNCSSNTPIKIIEKVPVVMLNQNEQNNKTFSVPSSSAIDIETEKPHSNKPVINLAMKEYTCRILCQNIGPKTADSHTCNESLIRKKNKQIQRLTETIKLESRSNSIESECLYFKPIDYRNNPRSEGLAPIKVPTTKPSVSPDFKIVAPCGQNKISLHNSGSAFVKLISSSEVIDPEEIKISAVKRKRDRLEAKSKKKVKNSRKSIDDETNSPPFRGFVHDSNHTNNNLNAVTTVVKKLSEDLMKEERVKKALQEQSDYEMARKLQEQFNQTAKYLTRSSTVSKRAPAKRQVKLEGIMTSYKVK